MVLNTEPSSPLHLQSNVTENNYYSNSTTLKLRCIPLQLRETSEDEEMDFYGEREQLLFYEDISKRTVSVSVLMYVCTDTCAHWQNPEAPIKCFPQSL